MIEEGSKSKVDLEGRVAIVTGAGGGLGRIYALELAKRGARVVVNDIGGPRDGKGPGSKAPADLVVDEIRGKGGEAVPSYDSVSTFKGGLAIVERAIEAFGRIDILINNAGIIRDRTLPNLEPEDWGDVLDVHLRGAYNVTRPAFSRMKEQGYGRIVMTTSSAGLYGNFGQTNYAAAKLGVVGFMNALKLEGAKHNVLVNAIAPMAATRLTEELLPSEVRERLRPEFVAPLVMYLCSEACGVSGRIYIAGCGYYARAAVLTGPGRWIGGGLKVPEPEEIMENWEAINSMEGAVEYPNAPSSMMPMLTGAKK